MYQLQARACQTKSGVYVTLAGFLANRCMQAEISGTYPGSIVHFVDPGHGEIFIDEKQRPGSQICLMHLVPWYAQAMLPGSTHKTVVIYVNGKKSLTVPVADEAALEAPKSAKSSKMPPSSTELAGGGLLVVLEASATVTSAKCCWFAVGKSNLVHVNLLSS